MVSLPLATATTVCFMSLQMKDIAADQAKKEAVRLMQGVGLIGRRLVQSRKLSFGEKRQLSVCIALAATTKVTRLGVKGLSETVFLLLLESDGGQKRHRFPLR